ncbi:MAG TPA: translesion error-prone DNA polymerase V autoproteolytic subunit [Victivallales bacterium]|nr:translesion error-prone DNA polymerase V autoproteolytic subunit [Victivallales bacterium]
MIEQPKKFDDNLKFYNAALGDEIKLPYAVESVSAGFPCHADGYIECEFDINQHLIKNHSSTFLVQVNGDSMINAGIQTGDMLVVDKSMEVKNNDIVIACVAGEFTVKRLFSKNNKVCLFPENPLFKPLLITEEMDFQVWGKVTNIIRSI